MGTGTTTVAAACAGRNSIGYEIDANFEELIESRMDEALKFARKIVMGRIKKHLDFIRKKVGNIFQIIMVLRSSRAKNGIFDYI